MGSAVLDVCEYSGKLVHNKGEEGAEEHDVLVGGYVRFDAFAAVQHAAGECSGVAEEGER